MANSNIINAVFGSGICAVTTSAFRANYGMVLRFSGIELPTAFDVDFSNYDVMGRDSITMIGQNGEVQIPDDLWDSGLNIYAYVYLHPTDDSGVTVYTVTIPVLGRPNRTEETPTPHEQSVIEQAISALNDAVEQTAADVETTTANAQAAAQSETNAATSERSAAASAGAALASQNAAHASETASAQSAQSASGSAEQASQSAQASAESADTAQGAAASAERSEQNASASAASAQSKATEAASSASTASSKANEASASATAAAQSAQSAAAWAANAADLASDAQDYATDAEQAKTDAQDAKDAAEQAAQSVSGLSAQIAQNTADIAELVQSKAGTLIDTATGSIASFVPDATIPTVRGLIVDIEPVQDLHGYENPWPAGGGKNKFDKDAITVGKWLNVSTGAIENTTTNYALSDYIPVKAGLPYVSTDTQSSRRWFYDAEKNPVEIITANPYTPPSDGFVLLTVSIASVDINTVQFEQGTTISAYSPYSNICPISGWDEVVTQRTAINVWDEEWEQGAVNTSDGSERATSNTIRSKNYCELVGGSTYYATCGKTDGGNQNRYYIGIIFYDAEKRYISGGYYNNLTFTAPENARYFKLTTNTSTVVYGNTYNNDISINYPSTDTAYHSGTGNATYQIQLGQTVYGGTLDATNGVLTVDRAEMDFGTLNWIYTPTWRANSFYAILPTIKIVSASTKANMLCEQYKVVSASNLYTGSSAAMAQSADGIRVADSRFSDAAAFKAAMSGVMLCYELATPITISLTPLEISVLTGQTNNVWADCGNVSVEYAADLKTYINNKIAAAVAALS